MKKDPRTDEQLYNVVRTYNQLRTAQAQGAQDEETQEDEAQQRAAQEAGAHLYTRYFVRVRGFFINKVPDASRCDDLTQQTFKKILYELNNMSGDTFAGYLFGVAYNELRSDYRKTQKDRQRPVEDIEEVPVANIGTGLSTLFGRHDEEQRLVAALRQIPIKYQLVFEMYYWQEMTADQIAVLRGIPLGTVRGQIRLAKQALASKLALVQNNFSARKLAFQSMAQWARELRDQLNPPRDGG